MSVPSAHSLRSQLEKDVGQTVLGKAGYRRAQQEVARLTHLCSQRTGTKDGRTVRQEIEAAAGGLRRSQPKLAADLDRALRDGCK